MVKDVKASRRTKLLIVVYGDEDASNIVDIMEEALNIVTSWVRGRPKTSSTFGIVLVTSSTAT